MLMPPLVIARKELVDHLRDTRSVGLTALYTLMGPAVVLLAFLQRGTPAPGAGGPPWHLVAAVFALMAAFTGSMAAAMDTIAGERERRSLVPLVVSASSRRHLIVGKWLALSLMSAVSLLMNVAAFSMVLAGSGGGSLAPWLLAVPALLSLALFAPACELLISTICRSTKEANTYVSLLVFGIMAVAMWAAFRPAGARGWRALMPMLGQQRLLELGFGGASTSVVEAGMVALQSLALTTLTAVLTVIVLAIASALFSRDEAVYGG